MAGYSIFAVQRSLSIDPDRFAPNAADILSAFAQIAAIEVKRDVWNYSMFVYKGIKPRPSFSKSERAWIGTGDARDFSITLSNGATNKKGTVYVPFVHLAGRPKSDKLVRYVQAHLVENVAPRAARAVLHDIIKARAVMVTRKVV
jgi:hypothetical protein